MTREQVKAARALLRWHQTDLAGASGLSLIAVKQFESGAVVSRDVTLDKLETALTDAGVEFLPGGVRLTSQAG